MSEIRQQKLTDKKTPGTMLLVCGHRQRVSDWRLTLSSNGEEQHMIWCLVCDNWREPTRED